MADILRILLGSDAAGLLLDRPILALLTVAVAVLAIRQIALSVFVGAPFFRRTAVSRSTWTFVTATALFLACRKALVTAQGLEPWTY